MKPRPLRLLTLLSLLLCVASVTMWATGYAGSPCPVWRRSAPVERLHLSVGSTGHDLTLGVVTPTAPARASMAARWGFGYVAGGASSQLASGSLIPIGGYRGVQVPLWLVTAATAGLPLLWAARWLLRRRRVPGGHCQRCGYNLTGNVSGVCPECGAARSSGKGPADLHEAARVN